MTLSREILERAAHWYVELRCQPDAATQAAHRQWLDSDPRHRQAWARLDRLQGTFGGVAPQLARSTLAGARAKRREVLKVLSLLLAAGGAGGLAWRGGALPNLLADQRTATGERRALALEDGSQVQLNTASAVDIRYSTQLRRIDLLDGEILVETAADARDRPFVVHTAEGSLRALGTRFLVRREGGLTRVGVLEHAVQVHCASSQQMLRVDAGQQLAFSAGQLGPLRPLAPQADAWSHGMLVVSDWRLGDFIAELQRYRPGHLGCAERVAGLRISGAFQLADSDIVLDNLSATLPVRIRRFSRFWVRVEAV
ncbi:FecR domain-containing protein [Pseudomonas japonica]|uniref:FecR family protein n=1 Tax=Pseudomonas japonica TaxID=256466 RepID=A0A239G335_9PSED|nr:FecR domain-containing protein [Pseudomonas japonica]SNS62982.1 FecR family protein [Pseudomonas japonica]